MAKPLSFLTYFVFMALGAHSLASPAVGRLSPDDVSGLRHRFPAQYKPIKNGEGGDVFDEIFPYPALLSKPNPKINDTTEEKIMGLFIENKESLDFSVIKKLYKDRLENPSLFSCDVQTRFHFLRDAEQIEWLRQFLIHLSD